MLEQKLALLNTKDDQAAALSTTNKALESLDGKILNALKTSGLGSAKIPGLSVSVSSQWRPKLEPEKWDGVMRWLVANAPQVLQRRMSLAPIMELVDAGTALPDGLTVESFTDLSHRRS